MGSEMCIRDRPTEVPTGHCEDDGSTYEFGGHCYKFLTNPVSWYDAVKACEDQEVSVDRFSLASVHSERESAFIKTMYTYLPSENQNVIFWFGATDESNEGEWVYVDGSSFDYTHWEGNEPNNQVILKVLVFYSKLHIIIMKNFSICFKHFYVCSICVCY